MAALPTALDSVESIEFPRMTPRNVREVLKELTAAPAEAVMRKEISRLTPAQQDTLMKVIYVGLGGDPAAATTLQKWHALLFEVAGPGSIVRTLTDKAPAAPSSPSTPA